MTRAPARTNFNSSQLVRLLGELALIEPGEAEQDFAERLGQWLNFTDAIALFAAHNEGSANPAPAPPAPDAQKESSGTESEITRLRSKFTTAIRTRLPVPRADLPLDIAADYEPYRRFYLAQQRDIETAIRPLRANARATLLCGGVTLKKLAALDETFDHILADRESKLLSALPVLLEKRFAHLRAGHVQRLGETMGDDDPALWLEPGAWLAEFRHDIASLLLAELELRLQPTIGLIEAFRNEIQHIHE